MPPTRSNQSRCAFGLVRIAAASAALLGGGCFLSNSGLSPSTTQMYFPTGLAVSPGRTALYVTNSDFDLQFSGGTVLALDLTKIRNALSPLLDGLRSAIQENVPPDQVCANASLQLNNNPILVPSPCTGFELNGSGAPIVASAVIGAFASGVVVANAPEPGMGTRLFVPVRGDPSVTWFDIPDDRVAQTEFKLDCGQTGANQRCDDTHRMGLDPYDNFRGLTLPVEPVGIAVSQDGTKLLTTHQTSAAVGLGANSWGAHQRPAFQFALENLVAGPTEVVMVPPPALWKACSSAGTSSFTYQPGFLVTFNQAAEVDLVRYNDDHEATPPRPFLTSAARTQISANADGRDSRGIAVDDSARKACEAQCTAQPSCDVSCYRECVRQNPLRVFIANRSPPSLLVGRLETEVVDSDLGTASGGALLDTLKIVDSINLSPGPSKVAVGNVIGLSGQLEPRVFVAMFDSKAIAIYDPKTGRMDMNVLTGAGPHALAFDTDDAKGGPSYSYLYVGHFTESYLGVVDLDMRKETFGQMFASIGTPIPPREAK